MTEHCRARQYSDQMICYACGLTWDVNDRDPPKCSPKEIVSKNEFKDDRRDRKVPLRGRMPAVRTPERSTKIGRPITEADWSNLKEALNTGDWSKMKDVLE